MKLQEKMFAMVQAWQASGMTQREFLYDKSIFIFKILEIANTKKTLHPRFKSKH